MLTKNSKEKIIKNFTFEKYFEIPDWQKKELDKTEIRIKQEFQENWNIKTYSQQEVDKKILWFINKI